MTNIAYYVKELNKHGIVMTSNPDIKILLTKYLEKENMNYICTMDDYFQYTIQLV